MYSFTGINSSEQCSTLCQDDPDCVAFTHYNQDSFPLSDMCVLFGKCIYRNPCNNCITGSSQNQCTCGIRYHGAINDNNLVQLISLTSASEKEPYCKARCVSHENCTAYTYYEYKSEDTGSWSRTTDYKKCFLLSHLNDIVPCDSCMSGPKICAMSTPTTTTITTTTTTTTESSATITYSSAIFISIIMTMLVVM